MKNKGGEKWLCQLCGMVKDDPKHHSNTHRHKTNMKKIEDALSCELIRHYERKNIGMGQEVGKQGVFEWDS